jgi:hypothetical protein
MLYLVDIRLIMVPSQHESTLTGHRLEYPEKGSYMTRFSSPTLHPYTHYIL